MTLTTGSRLGPYEVVAPLGVGGMGEVYRARDTRLGRDVAVKVLPQHLSTQPEVRARFEREAKMISSLNHPNICVLFDIGVENGVDYLVMELIEGDTLAERLTRGPLPPADLLRFGAQIADALDRAHRAGVVHRDLKPGNVMLTRSGAKLMDFGLSRIVGLAGQAGGSGHSLSALAHSPTMAQPLTAEGTLLGTFQYMSPEQLEGREADARSDIWALGCVLYEMATGRRAFEGRSQASLIAAILEREPAAVGEAPQSTGAIAVGGPPPGIERLIKNCLAKDPEDRIQTAHDVKLRLQGIADAAALSGAGVASAPASIADVAAPRNLSRRLADSARLAWACAAGSLLAAAAVFALLGPRDPAPEVAVRFRLGPIPKVTAMFWPRVSPDGKFLVVDATDSTNVRRAYVRPMNQIDAHPIPGTEGLQRAYWSPDSREIAFVANQKIHRVTIAGGSPVEICAAPGGADLSWGSKGLILMDGRFTDSLRVVPAGGGELRPATRIDRASKEAGCAWPCFLPDGESFLFIGTRGEGEGGNIRLGKIGSLDSKLLGVSDGRVEYAPGGWVLFLRGSTLLAQKLDLGAGKLTGQPITLTDEIAVDDSQGHFSVSQTGILAFAKEDQGVAMSLRAANRAGALIGPPLAAGELGNPVLSPDGRRLLYQRMGQAVGRGGEIHVLDLDRGTNTRLTFTNNRAHDPAWSPDGKRFAYVTRTSTSTRLRIGAADGLGVPDSIPLPEGMGANLTQWTSVDSRLVFFSSRFKSMFVPAEGAVRIPAALVDSTQFMAQQQISPDGRWLAFVRGNLPNVHVYVQSLVGPPGRWQISTTPAQMPRWTRGGREIVYEGWDGRLMAVECDTKDGFHPGTPHALFTLPARSPQVDVTSWTCDADGERFYLTDPEVAQSTGTIEVVTDFNALVSRR